MRAYALEARNRGKRASANIAPLNLNREVCTQVPLRRKQDRVAIWKYVSTQTHLATESKFWLCLSSACQIEMCGRVNMWRCGAADRKIAADSVSARTRYV